MPLQEEILFPEPEGKKDYDEDPIKAGTYQVVVDDVKTIEGRNFVTKQPEPNFLFKTRIVEEDNKNHYIGVFARVSWFNGVTKKGSAVSPSKLYTFVKAIYAHYNDKIDLDTIKVSDLNKEFFNDLVGKQLMLVVDLRDDKNRVTGFSPIKKKIEIPEEENDTEVEKIEDVDPDDIPF